MKEIKEQHTFETINGKGNLMETNINHHLEKTYNAQRYFSVKAVLWTFAAFMFLSALLIFVGVIFKFNRYSIYIAYALLCTTPFVFSQKSRNIFTRDVVAEFNNQSVLIKEYALKGGDFINEFSCRWEDIKYYKTAFSGGYTDIIIHLKDGVKRRYLFKDNKTESESLQEESIFSIFYSYISRYNADKSPDERIYLSPLFLATKPGTICLILLSILGVAAITTQIFLARKYLPVSLLIGANLVLQLYLRRRNYKKTYNNIMQLDDDSQKLMRT